MTATALRDRCHATTSRLSVLSTYPVAVSDGGLSSRYASCDAVRFQRRFQILGGFLAKFGETVAVRAMRCMLDAIYDSRNRPV
jgi:hypothetical protein